MKRLLLSTIGLAALVLNPLFACEGAPDFHYGAAEMRAAIEGTWQIAFPAHEQDPARSYTVTIRQGTAIETHSERARLVREAAACGHRSLVRSAGACMDISDMPLEVVVEGKPDTVAFGHLQVIGTTFERAQLRLDIDLTDMTMEISPRGEVLEVVTADRVQQGTMVRVAAR